MENVKRNKQKILQKVHFQFGVGDGMKGMQVGVRKGVKFFWTVFKENDDMNRSDVFVIKIFGIAVFYPLILAEQKVGRVAGGALAGKAVADLLYLDIGDTSVFKFDDDVGDQKRWLYGNAGGIIWQNF